uniref:Uncharacterized protein n=1 Tax=Knipowitschia caucasica TaxID=637954 RepID=A0AAV2LBM2_KNICA
MRIGGSGYGYGVSSASVVRVAVPNQNSKQDKDAAFASGDKDLSRPDSTSIDLIQKHCTRDVHLPDSIVSLPNAVRSVAIIESSPFWRLRPGL